MTDPTVNPPALPRPHPGAEATIVHLVQPLTAANDNVPCSRSALPEDAEAIIYRPAPSPMSAGRARSKRWVLEFLPRSTPFIDPLTGWTGGCDPLRSVRLGFPSRETAETYARSQGLRYRVNAEKTARSRRVRTCPAAVQPHDPILSFAWDRPELAMPDLAQALLDPARFFAHPRDIAQHPLLSTDEKRKLLTRWLWDAHRAETRRQPGTEGQPSRLNEVQHALASLEGAETPPEPPHRGAPAARPWSAELETLETAAA